MFSKPASRRTCTARRTSSGPQRRSSTSRRDVSNDCAPSDTRLTRFRRRSAASSGVTVSGFASTVTSSASGSAASSRSRASGARERRRAAAEEDRLEPRREHAALQLELREKRRHVPAVLLPAPDDRDEVAVAAPVHAERHVDVEVADAAHFDRSPFRSSTARNASCGTSTIPTCFIRFLPFFWRSISFRLRVMSPP